MSEARPKILFLQMNMRPAGGANAVAAWIVEALKREYEITLLSEEPTKWSEVNRFFGTSIREDEIEVLTLSAPLRFLLRLDPDPGTIQPLAYLMRICRRIRHNYDLVISAATEELDLGGKGILYVHYPGLGEYWRTHLDWDRRPLLQQLPLVARGKIPPWILLSGYSIQRMKACRVITNSDWTAGLVSQHYGIASETVYPPVTSAPNPLPWQQRENSFIAIGRFNRLKRFDSIINLLSKLRPKYPDLALYLVGTRDPNPEGVEHSQILDKLAKEHSTWVTVHENLERPELLNLLGRVRYAISAKLDEHFGIAPAEAMLAGCITFVHNSGGQVEIPGRDPRLCFSDSDALQKIDRVLADAELQNSLRIFLKGRSEPFTAQRFMSDFRRIVSEALEEGRDGGV